MNWENQLLKNSGKNLPPGSDNIPESCDFREQFDPLNMIF